MQKFISKEAVKQMFRRSKMRHGGAHLFPTISSSRRKIKSIHRCLLTLTIVCSFLTTLLFLSGTIGKEEQWVQASHIDSYKNLQPEKAENNKLPDHHEHPGDNDIPDKERFRDSDYDVKGRFIINDSGELVNILDSKDADYSVVDEKKNIATKKPPEISKKRIASPIKQSLKLYSEKGDSLRSQFNCKKLFKGDVSEQKKVTTFCERYNYTFPTLSFDVVPDMLTNCEDFKAARQYREDSEVTQEERDFPIAYVILAHLDFEYVERLIRTLYTPQNVFCIHLDAKAPASLEKALKTYASCFPKNIIMSSDPQRIVYAHVTRLLADISCMRDLVKKGQPWRYLINMAATELPLRTNLETVRVLKTFHGLNDIRENESGKVETRYQFVHEVSKLGKMRRTKKTLGPPPHNLTIVKGLAYNTYSREFIDWAMTDQRAIDFLKWSELTFSPDEHYWATLNDLYDNPFLKTPGGFKGHPDKKGYVTKFIHWQQDPEHKCYGRVAHNICLFSALDLPLLVGRHQLAANKFDLTYDPVAYACVEEDLENRTREGRVIDVTPYKMLYFIRFDPEKEKAKKDAVHKNNIVKTRR